MKKYLLLAVLLIPSISFAAFDANLKYGATGNDVKELQEFLIEQGCMKGTATGNFFSITLNGIKCFQIKNGIYSQTGTWDPATRSVANEILGGVSTSTEEQSPVVSEPDTVDSLVKKLQDAMNQQSQQNTSFSIQKVTTVTNGSTTSNDDNFLLKESISNPNPILCEHDSFGKHLNDDVCDLNNANIKIDPYIDPKNHIRVFGCIEIYNIMTRESKCVQGESA